MTDLIIEQARAYFDALVKSRFIEMFGHQDQNEKEFRISTIGESCIIRDSERIPITSTHRESGPYPYYGANGLQDYVKDYIFDGEFVLVAEDGGYFDDPDRPIAYSVSGKCWVNNHAHILQPGKEINVQYLEWALKYRDITNVINGTTRSKLTQAAMRSITILLPPKELQDSFSQFLIQVDKSKVIFEKEVARYDDLIKSRFIEMFGTVRDNNLSLPIMKMGDIVEIRNGRDYKTIQNDNGKYPVYGTGGIITHADDYLCPENTVIIGRKGTINNPILVKEKFWNVDTAFGIICDQSILNPIYYFWFCKQYDFTQHNKATTIPSLVKTDLQKILVIVPDKDRQDEFAAFVEQVDKSKLMLFESLKNIAPNN